MEEIKRIREVAKYLERSSAIDIADELNQCCDSLEKAMKDLVIISDYDYACQFSVMIDEKVYNTSNRSAIFDEILTEYRYMYENEFKKWLKEKFKNKTIIICEDGNIEVLK